ncbi:MAG: hypothetical protein ACI936_002040 [Paraglaciecola sp.]|jgi:hypothetical protein
MKTLNNQETTTLIASLRLMQTVIERCTLGDYELPHFEEVEPLSLNNIDALIEDLNIESLTLGSPSDNSFAFNLKDETTDSSGDTLGKVENNHMLGLSLGFAGYSDLSSDDFSGAPVYIEKFEGKLLVRIYGDINSDEATHQISLEGASITCRAPDLDNLLTSKEQNIASKEGWDIFCIDGSETDFQIQKEDDLGIFNDDKDAWTFIAERASKGSALHQKVLDFMKTHALDEYNLYMAPYEQVDSLQGGETTDQQISVVSIKALRLPELIDNLSWIGMVDDEFKEFTQTLSAIQTLIGQEDGGMASMYFDEEEWGRLDAAERSEFIIRYISTELRGLTCH